MSMNDETNWKPKETPVDLDKRTGASVSCCVCCCVDHVQLEVTDRSKEFFITNTQIICQALTVCLWAMSVCDSLGLSSSAVRLTA